MAKKRSVLCSIAPDFPATAFILSAFILQGDTTPIVVTFPSLFSSIEEAAETVRAAVRQAESEEIEIQEECVLIPVEFAEHFPLRKDYWGKPTLKYTDWNRVKMFLPLLSKSEMYHVLVTPSYIQEDGTALLHATLPILDEENTALLEQFMLTSDQVVDQQAKFAGIYKCKRAQKFNWKTLTINEMQKEKSSSIDN